MRKGNLLPYTERCTGRRGAPRHRLLDRAHRARVCPRVWARGLCPAHDTVMLAQTPRPRSIGWGVSSKITVPCCSARAPHFGLSPRMERWVVVVCVAVVLAILATVAAGGGVWVGMQ